MRYLLKVNIPVQSSNAAAKAGKLGATIQSILADLKPEAVYFADDKGTADRIRFSRDAKRFANPSHRRAVVSRV